MNSARPNRILRLWIALGVIVLVALIVAPEIDYGYGELNLTTYSAGPYGARGLYETAERLGWPVQRRLTPFRDTLPANATYVLLAPPVAPGARETANLLDAVRRGARLLLVQPTRSSALSDSLGIAARSPFAEGSAIPGPAAPPALTYDGPIAGWLVNRPDERQALTEDIERLLLIRTPSDTHTTVAGMRIGSGRVVIAADADVFGNERQRQLDEAVLAARLLEWLESDDDRYPLIFSEWHHGRGVHPSAAAVLSDALLGTAPGRTLLVLLFAGAVLLLSLGARPVAPEPAAVIERRSPFEHVDALSRAYQQIGATRLATRHLVRGLMRRRAIGGRLGATTREQDYLSAIRERHPQLESRVRTLNRALDHRLPPADFVEVGEAVQTIERTLTQ